MNESPGGRPGLPSLIVLMVSVDVKQHLKKKTEKKKGEAVWPNAITILQLQDSGSESHTYTHEQAWGETERERKISSEVSGRVELFGIISGTFEGPQIGPM